MKKSGLADSPLFKVSQQDSGTPQLPGETIVQKRTKTGKKDKKMDVSKQPRNRDTTAPRNHATMKPRNHDTTVSRHHDTMVEVVRTSVKALGKEAATHRFTQEEKQAIVDIVYAYKQRNIKTSENEITRIGVNFILQDHKENGKRGILDRVIKALNL